MWPDRNGTLIIRFVCIYPITLDLPLASMYSMAFSVMLGYTGQVTGRERFFLNDTFFL